MSAAAARRQPVHAMHEQHDHVHRQGCGHVALSHRDHVDYLHDGHQHTAHGEHWDECVAGPASRGGRATRQRAAVAAALAASPNFRSAQELHAALRRRGEAVSLATVYRHLQALADAGELDVLRTAAGETMYRRCASTGHHHHLICRRCRRTVEVDAAEVETWAGRVAAQAGFRDIEHVFEVLGTCAHCTG